MVVVGSGGRLRGGTLRGPPRLAPVGGEKSSRSMLGPPSVHIVKIKYFLFAAFLFGRSRFQQGREVNLAISLGECRW